MRDSNGILEPFANGHERVMNPTDDLGVRVCPSSLQALCSQSVRIFCPYGDHRHPTETWMEQVARNALDDASGHLRQVRYVLQDRDTKFCASFTTTLASGGVKCIALPARSPNLNAFAERWVRSVKEECLSKLILFGERALQRAVAEFLRHYHAERNHQGKGNALLFPSSNDERSNGSMRIQRRERLGGLLNYYSRAA